MKITMNFGFAKTRIDSINLKIGFNFNFSWMGFNFITIGIGSDFGFAKMETGSCFIQFMIILDWRGFTDFGFKISS